MNAEASTVVAKNTDNEPFVIDEDELCAHIVGKLGFDEDTVSQVLDGEMLYLEQRGLVIEEGKSVNADTVYTKTTDVRAEEMAAFIVGQFGLSEDVVRQVLHAEAEYMRLQK